MLKNDDTLFVVVKNISYWDVTVKPSPKFKKSRNFDDIFHILANPASSTNVVDKGSQKNGAVGVFPMVVDWDWDLETINN